ncbi:ABC transporter permease subunit [Lachnospiraceae bacterium OttesenSCG-928-D06]|nr:ABC transporter permease subunit [Lachnospiraceae bacterium OttesenSCG-928-D06]
MKGSYKLYFKKTWQLYVLMCLPLIFVLIFKFGSYFGLTIAFKDYKVAKGFSGSEWVGWDIFQKVFSNRNFGKALKNTLLLNILDLIFSFPMPIILALCLNEIKGKWFKKISQTLLYLPHFLSWIIIGALAYQLLSLSNGIVNVLVQNIGQSPIPFLQDDAWWLFTYVFIGVWQSMGWGTIVYLAAITSVNPELYEAAIVDGAGRWKRCVHVTLPCIRSTIVTLLIMNLGRVMQGSFERIYALSNAKVTEYTTTIPVLIYRWGIESGKFSEATALGLFQSAIGLLLVIIADLIAKKLGEDGLI